MVVMSMAVHGSKLSDFTIPGKCLLGEGDYTQEG